MPDSGPRTLGDWALHYAQRGFEVIPVSHTNKAPLTGNGFKDATSDPATIAGWWNDHPHALIGCRIPDGVVVLDIDPRHGGHDTWAALQAEHGPIPTGREHRSGRGDDGAHRWFIRPDVDLSTKRLSEWARTHNTGHATGTRSWTAGIDILHHDQRYTILPPSPHPDTGKPYTWTSKADPAVMPQWLVDLLTKPATPTAPPRTTLRVADDTSIADWYSAHTSWNDILGPAGWVLVDGDGDSDGSKWRHPNATHDTSSSIRHGCLFVYTPNTDFDVTGDSGTVGYTRFRAWAILEHGGDLKDAARAARVARDGHPTPPPPVTIWNPPPNVDPDTGEITDVPKPDIIVSGRHLNDLADEVVATLVDLNQPPILFRHGDAVSHYHRGELDPVDRSRLVHIVERSMRPWRIDKEGKSNPARLDPGTLDLTLLRLLDQLPDVQGVVRTPFLRADGTICNQPGHDTATGNYLAAGVNLDVPTDPTADDLAAAVAVIDDVFADFPFAGTSDRAHLYSLLLTPLIRHLVNLVPLHIVDGNGPGVGKNLLAECAMYLVTGEWVQTDPLPLDNEEQRKQITSLLSTGRSVALFDEAHIVGGTSLARLITSATWGDRLLGYSKQVAYPNRLTVVALGNNVEIQGDMPRRSIVIRLESQLARPYDRADFRHDDLRAHVVAHRGDILTALLTLLVGWHRAGQPKPAARLGSFDKWAVIVGGTLTHAGIAGFLSNVGEMRERGAIDDIDMENHLIEITWHVGANPFSAKDVARLLEQDKVETRPPKMARTDDVAHALGYVYRRYSGRWLGAHRIVPDGNSGGRRRWVIQTLTVDNPHRNSRDGGIGDIVSFSSREEQPLRVVEGTHGVVHAEGPKPSHLSHHVTSNGVGHPQATPDPHPEPF